MTPNNNEDDNRDNNTNNIDKSATSTTDNDTTTTTTNGNMTTTTTSEANETSTATVMTETITSPHTFQSSSSSSSTTTPSSSTSPSTFSPGGNNDDNENDHLMPHMNNSNNNNNNINSNDNPNEGGDDEINEHNNQQQKLLHSDMTDDSSSITITNNDNNSNINNNNNINNNSNNNNNNKSSSNHRNSSQGGVMTDGCSTDHHTNNHTMTLNTYSNQTTTTRTRTSTATSVMDSSGDQRTTTTTPVFSNDDTSAHLDLTLTADTEDPLQPIASSSSSDDALKKKQKKSFLTGKKVLLGKVPTSHARKQQQKKRKNGGSGGDHHRQRIDSVSPSSPTMVRLNTSARHSTSMSVRSMCANSDENHESFDNTFTGSSAMNTARGENFLRQNTLAPNASTGKGEPCMEYDGNHDDHNHHDDHHHHDHAQCSHQDKNLLLQLWPSKTTLLFGGRVMLGADKGRLSFTALLIVGVFLLFVTFITSYFYLIHLAAGIIMTVFPIGAVVYVLGTLYITATMDPGIVPRKSIVQNNLRDEPDLEELEEKFPQETTCVFVGGKPVFLRYCYTCKLYRPPRSSHCSHCDNCVERFDHHCPWTGTCIGKRNYRPFMHFVGSAAISLVFAILICVFQIAWSCYELGTTQPFKITGSIVWQIIATIFSAGIILISIALLAFVGALFCFHLYLISCGKTTSEHIKSKKGPQASFSQGFWGNWISGFLCAPCEPSKLPFRRPLSLYHAIMLQPEEDDVSLDKA